MIPATALLASAFSCALVAPAALRCEEATPTDRSNVETTSERLVIPLAAPDLPAAVVIVLAHGDIDVQVGAADEIIVEITPTAAGSLENGENSLFVIPESALDLPVRAEGNRVSVGMWSTHVESVRVLAPRETSVSTRTSWAGNVVVDGLQGAHELETNGGDIRLTSGRGSVVASSKDGNIDVELLQVTAGKPMSFATLNGDIEIGFPASLEADLRLSSNMGDVRSEFEIALAESPTRISSRPAPGGVRYRLVRDARGTIGGGGPDVSIRTHMGSISLRKLTTPG